MADVLKLPGPYIWPADGRAFGQAGPARRLEAKKIYQGVVASPHAVDAI